MTPLLLAAALLAIQPSSPRIAVRQDIEACTAQPSLPWCGRANLVNPGHLTINKVWEIEEQAFYHWEADDPSKSGAWRSHADDVTRRRPWRGLCGDMTFTVLDLLGRAGFRLDRMWRVIVADGPTPNHMVGLIELDDGSYWIVGDTSRGVVQGSVYPLKELAWKPTLISAADEGPAWIRVSR